MNIFFDIDYTILDMGKDLRPRTWELFEKLQADGHTLYAWSGNGVRWADMARHGLDAFLSGIYEKPLPSEGDDGPVDFETALQEMNIPVWPDFVVDDYQIYVNFFGGLWVRGYFVATKSNENDREMERVYRVIKDVEEKGYSDDPTYHSGPGIPIDFSREFL